MPRLLRFALGLVCGWLLSRLRLVPGHDWLGGPESVATQSLIARGAAVAFVGLALGPIGRDVGPLFLLGLAVAVAFHGLVLGGPLGTPGIFDVFVIGLALGVARFWIVRGESARPDPAPERARIGERIGLFVAGGGAAVVLEVVARHMRLLGGGLAQDDSAFATVFATLVALGGVCFGWIGNLRRLERWSAPWLVVAVAAAGYWSLGTIASLAQGLEFSRFLARYGLDASWHATLSADALIAGAVLVLPAFVLGLALRAARGAGSLSSLLVGAGVGLALIPRFLGRDPDASTATSELFAAQLMPFALLTALLGAGLALLSIPGGSSRARWATFALALPLGLPVLLVDSKPLFVLSPWERHATMPFLAFETPEGLATVEPGDGALKLATLDRRELSPGLDGVRADSRAIESSFRALPPDVRDARAVRVLLVGQLTQVRASELTRNGAVHVDRTGAWHAAMARLEGELLKDYPAPPGDVLAPRDAEQRFANGDYDLCIALAADGDQPRWREIPATPARTVVVRWTRADQPVHGALPGSRFAGADEREPLYALACGGLDRLMLGVLDGAPRPTPGDPGRVEIVRLDGPSAPMPVAAQLAERKAWRAQSSTARIAAQLLADDPDRALIRGVDAFARAQIPSSPFETDSQKIELEDETLVALREAALAEPPSAFTREAWNWLARILSGKRDVAAIEAHVAPIAARWKPWPELEVALARADLEALDPEAAVARLAPLAEATDVAFDVLAVLGDAREQSGDARGAIGTWQRALALRPADLAVRRRLAMARVRAGDPAGADEVRALLGEHPDDEELKTFRGPGPWPPVQRGASQEARPH